MRRPPKLNVPAGERWLVTGGTGFIGRRLVAALADQAVTVLTRRAAHTGMPANVRVVETLDAIAANERFDVIVHLAGEPIASGLWTSARRQRIAASRPQVAQALVQCLGRLEAQPRAWINASAIGWYGLRGCEPLTEAADGEDCFLHRVCAAAEAAAAPAQALGIRVTHLRIGLALAQEGGVLARMLPAFKLGLGGPFGAGGHWMSWIERDDLVRLIAWAANQDAVRGPLNATAPNPVDNATFTQALAKALGRPAFFRVPRAPMTWLLGDFARELLFAGQRVVPQTALEGGFEFRHANLEGALDYALS